ncbi:hypothetical protein [Massilia sp. IC2-476]|uniref:hypothetical protein n=1 Tax=Massilia sp. IC2-476 TaxID=2887199 RepID=UPI001D114F19|nr:hypothetical protein [Massilia sp. IC2-476]MCC2970319.1 hypothetical protein [Massilia sp. IC2-476]
MATTLKTLLRLCAIAALLTYASLLVPGRALNSCGDMGPCPVLAYGFPLPFLADSQAISPVGSVARDPLSLLIGIDDILWPRFWLAFLFWMLLTLAARWAWRWCKRD